jgi:FKBP-type peptidyl-prolyl cis-trans isomerase 2
MRRLARLLAASLALSPALAAAAEEKAPVVEDGRTISIEYTLTLADGSTADTNVGKEPLQYKQGGEQLLPALEAELAGLEVGATKKVTLSPEKGYGAVDPGLYQEIDLELIPEEGRSAGAQLVSEDATGEQRVVRVREVKGDKVVIDFNHPLAGQTLNFDIKILAID